VSNPVNKKIPQQENSAVTECYQTSLEFPPVKRRKVEADFSGGDITSNGVHGEFKFQAAAGS
jgi:hypothetical protein